MHLFKIHHKESPSVHGAAAKLSYQVGVIFQKEISKYLKKDGVGKVRACLHGAHSCMSFFMYYDYLLINGTACVSIPITAQEVNHREKRFIKHNCELGIQ